MDRETLCCYHCGTDLGVKKVIPRATWTEEKHLELRPPLTTIDCPRCHRPTVTTQLTDS